MQKHCDRCGSAYQAKRAAARWCSDICRKYAWREGVAGSRSINRNVPTIDTSPPPLIDPDTINPRWILAGIAADPDQPGAVRVQACKALLGRSVDDAARVEAKHDRINQLAVAAMARGRLN